MPLSYTGKDQCSLIRGAKPYKTDKQHLRLIQYCVLLNISSCYTQKWHMHTMVYMHGPGHPYILWTNWSKCTYTICEYDNKLEISASREHITVHKSALAGRRKQMLISAANSSSGTSPSYTVITVELSMGLAFCPPSYMKG